MHDAIETAEDEVELDALDTADLGEGVDADEWKWGIGKDRRSCRAEESL